MLIGVVTGVDVALPHEVVDSHLGDEEGLVWVKVDQARRHWLCVFAVIVLTHKRLVLPLQLCHHQRPLVVPWHGTILNRGSLVGGWLLRWLITIVYGLNEVLKLLIFRVGLLH